jgi:hypothetical protein
MASRKGLSKKTRFDVFKRDAFICQYCGAHPPSVVLHVDHIVSVKDGGGNDMDNLVTSCLPCNLGKSATPLNVVPQSLRDKAADIAEREEQLLGYHQIIEAQRDRIDAEIWSVAEVFKPGCSKDGINRSYLQSIKRFLEKLDYYEVFDAMEIAVTKIPRSYQGAFKYFCGICWRKIERANGTNQNSEA